MGIELRAIPVPAALGTAESAEFEAYVDVTAAIEESIWGHRRFAETAGQLLPEFQDQRYSGRRAFAAWDGVQCVARAETLWEQAAGAKTGEITVGVLPAHRGRGLGTALLHLAEDALHGEGRSVYSAYSDVPLTSLDRAGPRLAAPDGTATIPAADPGAAFAATHGYRLAQLERISSLPLSDRFAEFQEALAARSAGATGYRIVGWADRAPEDLLDSLATAHAAMATDAPAGGLTIDETPWDAERVRAVERRAAEGGTTTLTHAAVAPDGTVAGFTELQLPGNSPTVFQWETIVVGAHRGHGLGMHLKLANLVRLGEIAPERSEVITWNADENDHMLRINLALGFRLIGYEALWERS